ncbi:MAG TPA: hypothetical protein VLY04_18370 [Bryobacteraceae bacterium]|nr:hypothetical protein [Bryobacteraceae bacterium]
MEAGLSRRRDLLLLAAFTVLLHLPFLWQPVQGDEITYLDIGRHVLSQPLTPLNFQYVFQGHVVDASGHPHPPLNGYLLALAWIVHGGFSAPFFHAFYLLFALGISFAAYALAARFTAQPLWAALLVAASPLVQVNTNTLAGPESPALAFLLIGAAAFFWRRFWISGIALTLAGLTDLQALAVPPILLFEYAMRRKRPSRAAWVALGAPYVGLAGWQALQWGLTHRLPGAVLLAYAQSPRFSRLALKGASALALLQHLGVLVTPVPLAWRRLWGIVPGVLVCLLVRDYPWWERALLVLFVALGVNVLLWLWEARGTEPVLAGWCLFYFAFAVLVFFAGASRYLLALVAPMVLLFVLQFTHRVKPLTLALAVNLIVGLNVSFAAYEFARVYAEVPPPPGPTFLVNGEWGFRYYMLAKGGRTLEENSVPLPGEWIVSSELSLAGNYDSLAEEAAVPLRTSDLRVRTPLRLIDRYAHSGFSADSAGLLPVSFSTRPLDRITYSRISSFLETPASWTPTQFSGRLVYVPAPGAEIRLPLDAQGALHFALFGHGRGAAEFRISTPSGAVIFARDVQVDGSLWEPYSLPLADIHEAVFQVSPAPGLQAGWGEMVCDSNLPSARFENAQPQAVPRLSFLNLGDLRSRPQLRSGWYGIEDGAWRWMAKEAEAVLRVPAGPPPMFEMQLFFPPDFMQRAGGPVTVSVLLDGRPFAQETYPQPGGYHLLKPIRPNLLAAPATLVTIRLNRAIPPGDADRRELGAVVQGLGFVPAAR